jgi:26S proteasome regulatory subunit N5
MVQYGLRHHAYLDVAKFYHKVWETPSIKEDVNGKGKTVRFVLSAPHALIKFDVSERRSNTLFTTLLSPRTTTNSPT